MNENIKALTPAQKRLVEDHVHLADAYVAHFLRRIPRLRPRKDDLIQNVRLGLVIAAAKFRPDEGCKFTTYAFWHFRAAFHRAQLLDGPVKNYADPFPKPAKTLDFANGGTRPECVVNPSADLPSVDGPKLLPKVHAALVKYAIAESKRRATGLQARAHRDAEIYLRCRFGGEFDFAPEGLAKEFGVSRERVRQIREAFAPRFERYAKVVQSEVADG